MLKTLIIDGKEYYWMCETPTGVIALHPVAAKLQPVSSTPVSSTPVVSTSVVSTSVVTQPPPIPPPSCTTEAVVAPSSVVAQPPQIPPPTVELAPKRKKCHVGVAVVVEEETIRTNNLDVAMSAKVYDYIASKSTTGWRASNGIFLRAGPNVNNEFRDGTTFFLGKETFRNKRVNISKLANFSGQKNVSKHAHEIKVALIELGKEFETNRPRHCSDIFEGLPMV